MSFTYEPILTTHIKLLAKRGEHPELIDMLRRFYESFHSVLDKSHPVAVIIRRGINYGGTLSPKLSYATLQMVLDSTEWGTC